MLIVTGVIVYWNGATCDEPALLHPITLNVVDAATEIAPEYKVPLSHVGFVLTPIV